MKVGRWETHPAADVFPMMDDAQLAELAADIRERGLDDEVVLLRDGKRELLLDGRNRVRACELAGVKLRTGFFTGKDPIGWVIAQNLHRRHLNESQRAMVAARLSTLGC